MSPSTFNESDVARQKAGQPTGGQFAEQAKVASGLALADEDHRPIELTDGGEETFDGDGDLVSFYSVRRNGDRYTVSGCMPHLGTVAELLDSAGDEAQMERASHVLFEDQYRWGAVTDFLESKYDGLELDNTIDGDDLAASVVKEFDHAPTRAEATEAVWQTAAQVHNETDRGTFGSPFVGTELAEHLDAQAFAPRYPLHHDGRWYPNEPMRSEQALLQARMAAETGQPVSDLAAQRLARDLSGKYDTDCFATLRDKGYTSREALDLAAETVKPEDFAAARALRDWAMHQPTTTDLLGGR